MERGDGAAAMDANMQRGMAAEHVRGPDRDLDLHRTGGSGGNGGGALGRDLDLHLGPR